MELLSAEEVADLPKQLFSKLNSFETPEGTEEFSETSLQSIIDAYISHSSKSVSNKAAYRCSVKCVLCPKVIPCTFNRRWETSNIEKHIKTHSKKNNRQRNQLCKKKIYQSRLIRIQIWKKIQLNWINFFKQIRKQIRAKTQCQIFDNS